MRLTILGGERKTSGGHLASRKPPTSRHRETSRRGNKFRSVSLVFRFPDPEVVHTVEIIHVGFHRSRKIDVIGARNRGGGELFRDVSCFRFRKCSPFRYVLPFRIFTLCGL
ncbi:hypothetical protein MTP99_016274 [Tenebrio molitor]|nr:hypothetical protein MTP99_016274 [Tenebrio molitor]